MGEVSELSEAEQRFLEPYLPRGNYLHNTSDLKEDESGRDANDISASDDSSERPFVTLTYATSLDSMISLAPGTRTTLSGPETKSMTHYLRMHHDCILVGVGTATADNPSLNCRYPGVNLDLQPQPVIVDPTLRWDVATSNIETLARHNSGKFPWIITASYDHSDRGPAAENCQRLLVDDNGLVPLNARGEEMLIAAPKKIQWAGIFKALKQKGIKSIMIEGGATVINELIAQSHLVDSVIITIAPTWLGHGGVTVSPAPKTVNGHRVNAANLQKPSWRQFGHDAVLCGGMMR